MIFKGELLGKPQSTAHALEIIGRLSGNYHFVKTGFIIKNLTSKREVSHIETSLVKFRTLTKQEIFDYVESNDGLGKAGAYGIQGLGRGLVDFHLGSLNNNVVGVYKLS